MRNYPQIKVSEERVLEQMGTLRSDKLPSADGIHPRVLKESEDEVAELLRKIHNLSLNKLPHVTQGSLDANWQRTQGYTGIPWFHQEMSYEVSDESLCHSGHHNHCKMYVWNNM